MAVAALIIALLALIVSVGSGVYTRMQGLETKRLAQIEAERRHEERKPVFVPQVEPVNGGAWYRLWLGLEDGPHLAGLDLEIIEARGVAFPPPQDGVDPRGREPNIATWGEIRPGERACWRIELWERQPREMRARVLARGVNGESWVIPLLVHVPPGGRAQIW